MRTHRTLARRPLLPVAAGVLLLAALAAGDVIELNNGERYEGLVVEQGTVIRFKVVYPNGGSMTRSFKRADVKDLTITGQAPQPAPAEPKEEPKADSALSDGPPQLSRDEVQGRIRVIGPSLPEWWNEVELVYPDTLDLAGTKKVQGWRPDINLGAYVWDRINPHPQRWREGVKLLHHVVDVRKGDPAGRAEAMEMLGNLYFKLLNDWERAAYWYETSLLHRPRVTAIVTVHLAECHWRIGSRDLAVQTLRRFGQDMKLPSAMAAQLWCQMGYAGGAMKMAESMMAIPQRADEGCLAAGNICRYQGRFDEAIGHYEKLLTLSTGTRYLQPNKQRARENLQAVQALKALDLSRVPDGVHAGEALGYKGPLVVKVHVASGAITRVEVVDHRENQPNSALVNAPLRIVAHPDFRGIDATTGASTTSDAVMNAAIEALRKAQK
ncbi:MAG: tetratricopeptide repeat protein [Planctomycetes bacterium]|nr:tetratricopeptide repeat protein [Planctomycetota bacterium]